MNGKIKAAWNAVKYFCATQTVSFCVGMALAVLLILNLGACVATWLSAVLCPVVTPILYLMMRAVNESLKDWKKGSGIWKGLLACEIGCAWVMILAFI